MRYSKFIDNSSTTMLVFLVSAVFLIGQIIVTPMHEADAKLQQTLHQVSRNIKEISTKTGRAGHGNGDSSHTNDGDRSSSRISSSSHTNDGDRSSSRISSSHNIVSGSS